MSNGASGDGDSSHRVVARRYNGGAVLHCEACDERQELREGEFHRITGFIQEHRGCALDGA